MPSRPDVALPELRPDSQFPELGLAQTEGIPRQTVL